MRTEHEAAGPISHDEAQEILSRFNSSHWHHSRPTGREVARYSIPANPLRDDDIRLGAYIAQQRALAAALAPILAKIAEADQACVGDDEPATLPVGELRAIARAVRS